MTTVYYLLQQRLVKQGKLPSAFKVQQTPTKRRAGRGPNTGSSKKGPAGDQERPASGHGNREKGEAGSPSRKREAAGGQQSPSVSPERRNRRKDLTQFEEMVNRTSVPRKSHGKADKNQLDDSDHSADHDRNQNSR